MIDMENYVAQVPKETTFEPFEYTGPAKIEEAVIEFSEKDSPYYGTGEGAEIEKIQLVVSDGEFANRVIFKNFNLDTIVKNGKGKTPTHRLADQLISLGMEFSNSAELKEINEKIKGTQVMIKCYTFKIDGVETQGCNITGEFTEELKFD